MVKSDLVKKLCDLRPNILRRDVVRVVDIIFDEIAEGLKNDMNYEIRGFGTFKIKSRRARIAKNPRTGEKISIPQKKFPAFKMSKLVKLRLNKNFAKQT